MTDLTQDRCQACRADAPLATPEEINEWRSEIPDWDVIEHEGIQKLTRTFKCKDYKSAVDFTNAIADLSEAEDHHPAILLEWGKVTVTWWSHKIKGLHKNDFIMAAKTEKWSQESREQ
jgi:4a-hydroxytetrahydrobiopterin dehydratase